MTSTSESVEGAETEVVAVEIGTVEGGGASSADQPIDAEPQVADETPETLEAPEIIPDPVLLQARDIARAALAEITDPKTIGADEGFEAHEERVLSLFFECRLPGYPGWRWTATLSRLDGDEVNVLEVELLPGPGSVVAPEWVPWSERLAQYREAQARQAADEAAAAESAAAELADEDEVDPEDDLLENDFSDFDDEIDGVDIDEDDIDDDGIEEIDDDDDDDIDDDDDDADDFDEESDDDSDDDDDSVTEADEDADDESDDTEEEDSEDLDPESDDEE